LFQIQFLKKELIQSGEYTDFDIVFVEKC